MLLSIVSYLLLVGPAVCFLHNPRTLHRDRLNIRHAEASTLPDQAFVTSEFTMREANDDDTSTVINFLDQLRMYHDVLLDNNHHDPTAPKSVVIPPLIKDGNTIQSLMPQIRNCHVILAQSTSSTDNDTTVLKSQQQPIGFASYHLKYTGFGPPLLHMEHLYVNADCRNTGIGYALMNEIANIGQIYHCSHIEWNVQTNNIRGIQFYYKIGAVIISQQLNTNTVSGIDPVSVPPQKSSISYSQEVTSTTMKWIPAAWKFVKET